MAKLRHGLSQDLHSNQEALGSTVSVLQKSVSCRPYVHSLGPHRSTHRTVVPKPYCSYHRHSITCPDQAQFSRPIQGGLVAADILGTTLTSLPFSQQALRE